MGGVPNILADTALFLWAPVVVVLFVKLRPAKATMYALLGGVLFLPELMEFDLPVVPPMNKQTVTTVWTLLAAVIFARRRLAQAKPFWGVDGFFVLAALGSIGTIMTNTDPLVTGPTTRPALGVYDMIASTIKDLMKIFLPFFLARAMVRSPRELRIFFGAMFALTVVYSILALVEVRLSPQMHRWVYGYHPAGFGMTKRWGGYRPVIFMLTGLAVANFVLTGGLLATAEVKTGRRTKRWSLFFAVVLVLCKSTGAIIYGAVLYPVVALTRQPKMRIALFLGALTLFYPLLRTAELFPAELLVETAETYLNEERALSLGFRFDQEKELLERALERPFFGWGSYSRNRIFDEETGEDLSVTDGEWVIIIGKRGLVGFVGFFGLLLTPLLMAWRQLDKVAPKERILVAALGLVTAVNAVDLLPNGLFNYLPLLYSGALAGVAQGIRSDRRYRSRKGGGQPPRTPEGASPSTAPHPSGADATGPWPEAPGAETR
jgi:hypothetical protein